MTLATEEIKSSSQSEMSSSSSSLPKELTYVRTLTYAAIVGAAGGVVATIYYFVLEQCLELVWETGREAVLGWFPVWLPHWHYTWIVATVGGLGVGLCLYWLGLPGEMAVVIDRVHDAGHGGDVFGLNYGRRELGSRSTPCTSQRQSGQLDCRKAQADGRKYSHYDFLRNGRSPCCFFW